jgi:hypothetical protein
MHYSKELCNLECCIEIFLVLNIHMPTYQVFYDLMKYYLNLMLKRQVRKLIHYLFEIVLELCYLKIRYLLEILLVWYILNPEVHKPQHIPQHRIY